MSPRLDKADLIEQMLASRRVETDMHVWNAVRQGGNPAEASSYERVIFCSTCGTEQTDENRYERCEPDEDQL